MFDLKNIKFKKTDEEHGRRHYSFVGIQKSKNNNELEFWLPLGFDDFDHTDYETVKSFFFKMYRTFKIYLARKTDGLKDEEKTITRDGVFEAENGFTFENQSQEQLVFYGKLNALDKILEGYDELKISSLEKKQVRTQDIDYSKIHKYMHQAVYLENDVIYLDEMTLAKSVLIQTSPPLLQLFSYIFTEIKREMGELENVPDRAFELCEIFRDTYLQPDSSLFDEINFTETLSTLRSILEEIDIYTTYKDEDYWHFYEAIESFLYGERVENQEGVFWGISNFYDIWEDMCQSYMLQSPLKPQILFADVDGRLENYFNINPNPFCLRLNEEPKFRMIRPDLVLTTKRLEITDIFHLKKSITFKSKVDAFGINFVNFYDVLKNHFDIIEKYNSLVIEEENLKTKKPFKYLTEVGFNEFSYFVKNYLDGLPFSCYQIIDYKYMKVSDYQLYSPFYIDEKGENKIKEDIHKQLIYEWTVQKNYENSQTESEFWIPYYAENEDFEDFKVLAEITNRSFNKSQIRVYKINFKILQQNYLKYAIV